MKPIHIILTLFVVGIFALTQTLFIVPETKQALVLQFGDPKREVFDAGLQFKVPILQQVELYDKRILEVDPPARRVILSNDETGFLAAATGAIGSQTKDVSGEPIIVDTFARYRITSPLKFRQRLRTERDAVVRLESQMNNTTRDVLGNTTLKNLLSENRAGLMREIQQRVNSEMEDLGIEVIDIRIGRADLTDNLKLSTYNRMISDLNKRATETRALGEERALEIRSRADKERQIIISEAQRDSDIVRGDGDKQATKIYADAFGQDKDFYEFYRAMEAYRNAFVSNDTMFVLSPDNQFFEHFQKLGN